MSASMRTCFLRRPTVIKQYFGTVSGHYALTRAACQRASIITPASWDNLTKIPIYQCGSVLPWQQSKGFHTSVSCWSAEESTNTEKEEKEEEDFHTIIKNTERSKGPSDKLEFQAETRKLLDIVARSLYSEKEVFIRELISNSSDALEKLRYRQMAEENVEDSHLPLEIDIAGDEQKKTITIQDTGIGMTREEMIENLGTIAHSGSKAFLDTLKDSSDANKNIIGQFGVGFYSSFMVGHQVDVYSKSYKPGSKAFKWSSDGTGTYELAEAEGVQRGTKIVIHLKPESHEFCVESYIKDVITKYSNFVGVSIFLNGKKVNVVQALWTLDPREVTEEMHEEFYRLIANTYDRPRYSLHYKTDAPLNIRAIFYVPQYKPSLFDMSRETEVSLQLYSRKVMIMSKSNTILPKWLRFMKGVVDSEDIPLNLSRELLQDSGLIRKLNQVLTNRLIKFFQDKAKKDPVEYHAFYEDYGLFFREGIVTSPEQDTREGIAKLLRFESSKLPAGEKTSIEDYCSRMKAGKRNIFYLSAPSREIAEGSPYLEALRKKDAEVLFLYEPYDELVLMNLGQFEKKTLKSIENELVEDKEDNTNTVDEKDENSLKQEEAETLMNWLKSTLTNRVQEVKITKRLSSHPCVITVKEMGAARHFLRTTIADQSPEERFRILQPTLEINPSHSLIKQLNKLQSSDPYLAKLLAEQLYDNAMVTAGLLDDPRSMVSRLNQLLEKALEKV
ncbi:heat shock protein 75 kDa, mitochondrial-like [Mercenaria mercenaria]|uniref:heat shock protein 75 kDa, mitochondrial-like n=1 Tax=Mercenaria mercenaria TaxID=6596 RepID=UPI00234E6D17|nr:heat shock protein 75 kDa, mitochondrial-like [Mercenaria mercenaria]